MQYDGDIRADEVAGGEDYLWTGVDGSPVLSSKQELRHKALSLAVTHHAHGDPHRTALNYRNQVETVFQTADFFFEYVKSGAHVDPLPGKVISEPHPELFVAQ